MNKLFILTIFCVSAFAVGSTACADTITLKSGKVIEGRILERTDEEIVVDIDGVSLTYYLDDVSSIVGVPQPKSERKDNKLTVKPDKNLNLDEPVEADKSVTDPEGDVLPEAASAPVIIERGTESYGGDDFMNDMGLKYVDQIEKLGADERERGEGTIKHAYQQLKAEERQNSDAEYNDTAVDQALDNVEELKVPAHIRALENFMKVQPVQPGDEKGLE